jgi:hypothetical protein
LTVLKTPNIMPDGGAARPLRYPMFAELVDGAGRSNKLVFEGCLFKDVFKE